MKYSEDLKKGWRDCFLKYETTLPLWAKSISAYNTATYGGRAMGGWPYIADLFILAQEVLREEITDEL